jgi:acetylornithine deacetylase/succinyl-diaminopimelate desuccinylase-like protein
VNGEAEIEATLAFARELVRTPSMSGQEADLARLVVSEMRDLGYDDAWTDAAGNAVGRVRGREPGLGAVVLVTHLDHVDPGDPALWTHPPFAGDVADGRLFGRGAADIKGPLAVQVHALGAVIASGARPRRDTVVVSFVDEEVGGGGARSWAATADFPVGLIVIGEPSDNQLALGHRGIRQLWVTFHGRSAHASAPERAENPNYALGEFLRRLRRESHSLPAHELLGPTTVSPTIVRVDTTSPNVTPAWSRVLVDFRTASMSASDLVAFLDRVAGPWPHTIGEAFSGDPLRPVAPDPAPIGGFYTPADHPAVRTVREAIAAGTGTSPELASYRFATDGRHLVGLGAPIVGYSPAEEDQAHVADESISIAKLLVGLHGYASLLERW